MFSQTLVTHKVDWECVSVCVSQSGYPGLEQRKGGAEMTGLDVCPVRPGLDVSSVPVSSVLHKHRVISLWWTEA